MIPPILNTPFSLKRTWKRHDAIMHTYDNSDHDPIIPLPPGPRPPKRVHSGLFGSVCVCFGLLGSVGACLGLLGAC